MKKIFRRKSASVEPQIEPQVEPNMAALIDKMQQQLTGLEKKIDTLISQSSERPSRGNNYSKPFRRFDNSPRFDRGGRDNNFRERSFTKAICADCNTECEVPFKPTGDRPVYCKECFAKHKDGAGSSKAKFEHGPRGGDSAGERSFDKPQGRENRRPGGIKKPSFRRKKGRD
jgi:CxxC-x17-CxxC domain-containing protein